MEKEDSIKQESIIDSDKTVKFDCRFYEEELPEENDLVKVQVKDVTDSHITIVELLEYNRIEGIITPNEFSKRPKVKSMLKLRKKGKHEICVVIRVDAEGGYIDLSKKRVTLDDAKSAESKYSNSKVILRITLLLVLYIYIIL